MGIYIFQIAFIILLPPFLRRFRNYKGLYCTLCAILLICVMGFRTEDLGLYDVKNVYFPMFDTVKQLSFSELIIKYPIERGNLFQICSKLFSYISENKYIWLFVTSIPYIAAMRHLIYKYSATIYVASFCFFMICGMRIYQTNFYLIRHSIAMAILVLAFDSILNKDLKKFLILTLIATMFHSTAAVFFIAYPLARIRPSWKQLIATIAGVYIVVYLSKDVMSAIFLILGDDNYYSSFQTRNSGFDSFTFPIICCALFLIAFFVFKKNAINTGLEAVTINMLCLGAIFMGAATMIGEFYRLSYFFMTVSFVGLGNIFHSIKTKYLRVGLFFCIFVGLFWFMIRGLEPNGLVPYKSWLFQ